MSRVSSHLYTRSVCVCKASAVSYSHSASWIHPTQSPFSMPSMVSYTYKLWPRGVTSSYSDIQSPWK